MGNSSKLGWLFGLVSGAVVGVLFAPRKGKDLRKQMLSERDKGATGLAPLGDDLKSVGSELKNIMHELYNDVRANEAVQEIIDEGADYFSDFKSDTIKQAKRAQTTLRKAKKHANKAKNEIKSAVQEIKKSVLKGKKNNGK